MNIYSTVRVNVGEGYDVTIGQGIVDGCGGILASLLATRRVAVVTDSNVQPLYLGRVRASLEAAGFAVTSFAFEAGEQSKNISTFGSILEFFARSGLTRKDCAIALGGGVVGDMTGFAAGCYMRGIDYIQMPTTMLAAIDSSVGGKTGIDLDAGKNLAGLFIQPKAVLCDTDCLATLPAEVYADGLAEAVKTAILGDAELFAMFEDGTACANPQAVIDRCVRYKASVVEQDEKESGLRKLLNLGHTPAHAIEKLSGYTIPHGRAVAMGLGIMARASAARGNCTAQCAARIEAALKNCALPAGTAYSAEEMSVIAENDKKRTAAGVSVVLIRDIGDCFFEEVSLEDMSGLFADGME
ncbi:MAG: 3-dehydroquinate synthase [Ruminococcaceae bacterium]|nr:3-dehydroquinate synthase [Oscillospiraceae bacterium]